MNFHDPWNEQYDHPLDHFTGNPAATVHCSERSCSGMKSMNPCQGLEVSVQDSFVKAFTLLTAAAGIWSFLDNQRADSPHGVPVKMKHRNMTLVDGGPFLR